MGFLFAGLGENTVMIAEVITFAAIALLVLYVLHTLNVFRKD